MLQKHFQFLAIILWLSCAGFAQEHNSVLFKINDTPVFTSEFERMYKKQAEMLGVDNQNSKKEYFDLFTLYKLKVYDAQMLGLDTLEAFKKEFAAQRERLTEPYLKDEASSEYLIQEAYERSIKKVNASHILLTLKPDATAEDTLQTYNKMVELRNRILNGEAFEFVARTSSEDPSVSVNGGNLGYFSAFEMIYPFENVAYKTGIGEVSEPFRTSYGYHIVQTNDFQEVQGEREVAHIMISDLSEAGKTRIDSIYAVAKKTPGKFEDLAKVLSDDSASANSGGKLPRMGIGDAIEPFEKVVFYELQKEEEVSTPFTTDFGWHIAKLIKLHSVPTKEEMYAELKQKVLSDARSAFELTSLARKLEQQYEVVENTSVASQILTKDWSISEADKQKTLLSVNGEKYLLEDFIVFLKREKNKAGIDAFIRFKESALIDYYKRHLDETDEDFKSLLKEFKEGLLLFNLMELKVWNPSKNTDNQRAFYTKHKDKYAQPFEAVQGKVTGDYQVFLEEQWVHELKEKYTLEIISAEYNNLINE